MAIGTNSKKKFNNRNDAVTKLTKRFASNLLIPTIAASVFCSSAFASNIFINELHYDNAGGDIGEGIEIAGPAGTSLQGWSVVFYNGSNGTSYNPTDLSAITLGNQCGGYGLETIAVSGIQNGAPDGLALVNPAGSVVQFISYEGVLTATNGPAIGMTSTDMGVQETSATAEGSSLQLSGSGALFSDFTWVGPQPATFGSCSAIQSFSTVDTAPQISAVSPADGADNVSVDSPITIAFNEAVTLANDWFALSCSLSGSMQSTLSGGPLVYSLQAQQNFLLGETCSITISADKVTDQDGGSNPLAENYHSSFTVTTEAVVTACEADATLISVIQGVAAAPVDGMINSVRTVKGVVTADLQATGFKGFYLQEEDADKDANPLTSEGIFVYQGNNTHALIVGSVVAVTATVDEYNGATQLKNATQIEQCAASGVTTAATVSLPVAAAIEGVDYLERFEGMKIRFDTPLTISENYNYGRYGQVTLSNGRLMQPTNVALPGAAASLIAEQNALNQILFDDKDSSQNPYPINNPDGSQAQTADQVLRSGNQLNNDGEGILNYSFGSYVVQPISEFSILETNPRTSTPTLEGDAGLKVASFNVLNYFTTLDQGATVRTCGPSGDQDCRGADSAAELTRQRAKIVSAIVSIDADIVGLMELENNASASLQDLVSALNAVADSSQYAYLDTGTIGDDAIKQGFIYQPDKVQLNGDFKILDQSIDVRFIDAKNRPALIQTFEEISTGEVLTVVVNHLKSKGSDCNALDDPDANDGQGNCNITRTQAAAALVDYLATDPTASDDPDFLIIGDLNAYAQEDPIQQIKAAGYEDLIANKDPTTSYSYVFRGQAGNLDHALANSSLAAQVSDIQVWHINADEPRIIDYNTEFKTAAQVTQMYAPDAFRSSDHDPVIVQIALNSTDLSVPMCNDQQATIYVDSDGYISGGSQHGDIYSGILRGTNAADVIVGTINADYIMGGKGADTICALAGADTISAGRGNDIIFAGEGSDLVFAGNGNDNVHGGAGFDLIWGGRGRDKIDGGEGRDYLFGGAGKDQLSGGEGSDLLFGGRANDFLDGGPGADYLFGGRGRRDKCINALHTFGCER